VGNVVGHDARKRQRVGGIGESRGKLQTRRPRQRRGLPQAPGVGGSLADRRVGMVQPSGVGLDDIAAALGFRQRCAQTLPLFGEEDGDPTTEEPVHFRVSAGRDPEVNHLADPLGISLGVGEREGTAPGAAEYQPIVDLQVLPQVLHVSDEVLGRVARQVGLQQAGVRRAPAAVALIEEHEAVGAGIEEPAVPRRTSRAGAAMHDDGRLPTRIAADLPVDELAVTHRQMPMLVRLDLGIQVGHDQSCASCAVPNSRALAGCPSMQAT